MSELLDVLKEVSNNANEASKPVALMFGTVTSESPLKILIEQKLEVNEKVLILTTAVKDHYVDMTVSHVTESTAIDHTHVVSGSTGTADSPPHSHDTNITSQINDPATTHLHAYKGRKKYLVHNGLKTGEKVVMMRVKHGQQFLVIDRVSEAITEGQML